MKRVKHHKHFGLMPLFTVIVFITLLAHTLISSVAVFFLVRGGVISISSAARPHVSTLILFNGIISIPIGFLVSLIAVKFPMRPIRDLIDGMDALASGDFQIRMKEDSIMRRYPAFREVSDSFNKMARELESTEMLRSDFINNFSHEFKTPIVSIAGFAKLLKRGKLPPEQQREYLDIIEKESLRLSYMATNVLSLTKVENQTILSDVTEYNLSEQLRSCILMLERKWESKRLDLQMEFGEHTICANEELLKQVWINLLDNAVKFTPEGHTVRVGIEEGDTSLLVTVMNTGSEIEPEDQEKIFRKFYQADQSHSAQGNGVGLAVVKRIVDLHGGAVSVSSAEEVTAFTVELPKKQ